MREIKVRAWNEEYKEMMDGDLLEECLINGDLEVHFDNGVFGLGNPYNGEKYILMQYTGLKDKNSIEIYEGDIVELEGASKKTKHIIKFSEGTFHFGLIKDGMCDYKDFEIIGNIYEKPDLI